MKNPRRKHGKNYEKRQQKRQAIKANFQENIHEIVTEEDIISESEHKNREKFFLLLRNSFVVVVGLLFMASFFVESHHLFRGVAYIFGAIAYSSELLILTDCFRKRVPHRELFMIYIFGPLYILMGIGYFLE